MNEDKVNFIKLPSADGSENPCMSREEFSINMEHIINDSDTLRKYVTFDGIE